MQMPSKPLIRRVTENSAIRWGFIGIMYLVVFLALHTGLWKGTHFLGWDAVRESWGDLLYGYKAIANGDFPLWNNLERAGYPFFADPQTAVLYPGNWLTYLGALFFGTGFWLALLRTLIHIAIGALGIHFLLQRMKLPGPACWLGGLCFILSARVSKSKDNAGLWSAVWLPWLLIALDDVREKPSVKSGIALGLATGMTFLAGYPPNFFRNLLAALPVFLFLVFQNVSTNSNWRKYLAGLCRALVVAVVVVIGLSLPNLLATIELVPHTVRTNLSLQQIFFSNLFPSDAIHFVSPLAMHNHLFPYMGILPVMLAAFALVGRWESQRLLWGVLAGVFFLFACGSNSFLSSVMAQMIPMFKDWRIPEQYLFVVNFFMALLAAHGLADILNADPLRIRILRKRALAIVVVVLLITVSVFAGTYLSKNHAADDASFQAAGISIVLTLFSGGILWGLFVQDKKKRQIVAWLGIGLLLVDLGIQLRPVYDILELTPRFERDKTLNTLKGIKDEVRLADEHFFRWRVGVREGVRDFYARHNTMVTQRYANYYKRARQNPALLAAANVRYYAGYNLRHLEAKAGKLGQLNPSGILEFLDHAPFAFWVGKPTVVSDKNKSLRELGNPGGWKNAFLEKTDLTSDEYEQIGKMKSIAEPVTAQLAHFG
ncbi:MAG: hypothetical protein V1754_09995, partial [Pseudomonadota bacterium]